ncbi:MAG: hypothetical protein ACFB6S_02200 [Geminicoccaceae bacterium]
MSEQPSHGGPVAVVDIGSNSVRLVIFQSRRRWPLVLYNQKVTCGLGRDVGATGVVSDEAAGEALTALRRFRGLIDAFAIRDVHAVATEALRVAGNGPDLIAAMEDLLSAAFELLSGSREAELAAAGAISARPELTGWVGDLGGGSLELARVRGGEIGYCTSLPLGPLRLQEVLEINGSVELAIERTLARAELEPSGEICDFYVIGGAWRAIARAAIDWTGAYLPIVDGLRLAREPILELLGILIKDGSKAKDLTARVAKRRRETLPLAAAVLKAVVERAAISSVTFTATGVREGRMFELLADEERSKAPLEDAVAQFGSQLGRFDGLERELERWTSVLFADQAPRAETLHRAACGLADLSWAVHPDQRIVHAATKARDLHLPGLSHDERAFLAWTLAARHGAGDGELEEAARIGLDDPDQRRRALILGAAIDLAFRISGGSAALLRATRLVLSDDELSLVADPHPGLCLDEGCERRLQRLAETLGLAKWRITERQETGENAAQAEDQKAGWRTVDGVV